MRPSQFALWKASLVALLGVGMANVVAVAGPNSFPGTTLVGLSELNSIRGGVLLPNGLDVDIGIDLQTEVNGVLVLHTVLSTAAPAASQLRVFSGGSPPSGAQGTNVELGAGTAPTLVIDRVGSSTTLSTSSIPLNPSVIVLNAPLNTWPQYPNENQINVVPNGPSVQTSSGSIQVQRMGDNTAVVLNAPGLQVQQLLGNATGIVVGNQLNNQTIQSTSVVDIDLHGTWPTISNALFKVGSLAMDSIRRY